MKKLISLFIIVLLCCFTTANESFSAVNKKMNANIKSKKVPAGTTINLKLLDPLSSSSMEIGDQFSLMVTDNVKVNNWFQRNKLFPKL